MPLSDYGWDDHFSKPFEALGSSGFEPARILLASAGSSRVIAADGERIATLAGRIRHAATSAADLPVVGDWVALRAGGASGARIEHVLPRRTKLSRTVAGKRSDEQVVAANIDVVLVVMGLDGDFNPRRLERLLITVWQSGAKPVVLLNKLDLCDDPRKAEAEVGPVAGGAPVILSSCTEGDGVDELREHIRPRETAVLVGSSGVGKSTLINRLLGRAAQKTKSVRNGDDRGRHTTTHRELFRLPDGGLLIDNPGIREVQLWSGEGSLAQAFDDVEALAESCRYSDCSHKSEPGCAVQAAVEAGKLESDRLESYRTLQKELRYLELKRNESAQRIQKQQWRAIHKEMRKSGKHRRR